MPKKTGKKKYTFKVKTGIAVIDGQQYGKGDIIHTDSDLTKFNSPGCKKFIKKDASGFDDDGDDEDEDVDSSSEDGLDDLSLVELMEVAKEDGVDLTAVNAKDKGAVVAAIRASQEGDE